MFSSYALADHSVDKANDDGNYNPNHDHADEQQEQSSVLLTAKQAIVVVSANKQHRRMNSSTSRQLKLRNTHTHTHTAHHSSFSPIMMCIIMMMTIMSSNMMSSTSLCSAFLLPRPTTAPPTHSNNNNAIVPPTKQYSHTPSSSSSNSYTSNNSIRRTSINRIHTSTFQQHSSSSSSYASSSFSTSSALSASVRGRLNYKSDNQQEDYEVVDPSSSSSSSSSFLHNDDNLDNEDKQRQQKQQKEANDELDMMMPWGTNQEWALRDYLPKYTVHIPKLKNGSSGSGSITTMKKTKDRFSGNDDDEDHDDGNHSYYAMWRSMTRDVVELSGYDVQFLQKMHQRQIQQQQVQNNNKNDNDNNDNDNDKRVDPESSTTSTTTTSTTTTPTKITDQITPGILPLLDQFEFQPNGGASGSIQGLPGISDGTTIQTSPLTHIELTLPIGYVLTQDQSTAYELGMPSSSSNSNDDGYFMDYARYNNNVNVNVKQQEQLLKDGKQIIIQGMKETTNTVSTLTKDDDVQKLMMNIGTSTAILFGVATTMNLLSHHLTVNVFWV